MNGSVANAQQCVAALHKARAKHGVLPIGTCLPQTLDSILVGHYAAPERLMLRKDEPHPMALLMVTAQFLNRPLKYSPRQRAVPPESRYFSSVHVF